MSAATLAPARPGGRAGPGLPGVGLTLGVALLWLGLLVLLPLAGLVFKALELPLPELWRVVTDDRALAALTVSFGCALVAALVDLPLGLVLAWALTRYDFPGRRLVDGLVDLPFALPTAVAGIALTTLCADSGWIGALLAPWGIKVAYTRIGIVVALAFIGLPFVVRSVQPVLADIEREVEEAALTLGADALQIAGRVILPALVPALLTGFTLAFARGLGEYGSVIFIAGNRPGVSEILPLLIVTKLEQFDYRGAAVLAVAMLTLSLLLLAAINLLQGAGRRHDA